MIASVATLRLLTCTALLGCYCHAASTRDLMREEVFEESSPGVWRTLSGPGLTIVQDGFVVVHAKRFARFEWNRSMRLATLTAEDAVPSHAYRLRSGVEARPLKHARRIRVSRRDGKVSIVYYFGPRGVEFDIQVAAGTKPPTIELNALDSTFKLDERGRCSLSDIGTLLAPVAFSTNQSGGSKRVSSMYRLITSHLLRFEIGQHDSRERLVIDPAVTYATYFDGSGNDLPIGLRELSDGTVFIAGNTTSIDLPQGVSLNSSKEQPQAGCFVARLAPALNQIKFVSYLDGASCSSTDIDSSGRILIAGLSSSYGLATPDAEYLLPRSYPADYFLGRISASGKSLDYATFLNMGSNSSSGSLIIRAGQGDFAYLSLNAYGVNLPEIAGGYQDQPTDSNLVLLRYDLSAHHFDRKTYLAGTDGVLGLQLTSSGSPYIFGVTSQPDLPLKDPVQTNPSTQGHFGRFVAGFVAGFSQDLSSLAFSTYLGGQGNNTEIDSLAFEPTGSLRLAGLAGDQSIPGLHPAPPFQGSNSVSAFSVDITPGQASVQKGFLAGGYLQVSPSIDNTAGLFLKDGRYCLLLAAYPADAPPGGAGFQYPGPSLGCLNDEASDFALVTPVASSVENTTTLLVAPSSNGGVWSLQSTLDNYPVPDDLLETALEPLPPPVSGPNEIILRYIDLGITTPVMVSPSPLELISGAGSPGPRPVIYGRNFADGMYLDLGGQTVPLTPTSSTSAIVDPGRTVNLVAGQYMGRLVMPVTPQSLTSDPFPVTVSNLPPSFLPFAATSDPSIFTLIGPTYPTSQVTWRGQPIPISPGSTPSGDYQIHIPAGTAPGPGELVQTNPRPGGGVEGQSVNFGGTGTAVVLRQKPRAQPLTDLPADIYQVDRQRLLLYTAKAVLNGGFEINSYDLGAGQQTASVTLPRSGANLIWDFQLSPDGSLLYLADDQLRIRRIRRI